MALPEVQDCITMLEFARDRYIHGLSVTPEDKSLWTPGGKTRNVLIQASRTANLVGILEHLLGTGQFPQQGGPLAPEAATLEAAQKEVREAYTRFLAVLEKLTAEDLERVVPAPWGEQITVRRWLYLANQALGYSQGQMNFLQLAYGDDNANMPPGYGPSQPSAE